MTSTPRTSKARAEFVDVGGRRLFTLNILPEGEVRGSALYVPPFAEEMNRCRSHAAAQARALAAVGIQTLLVDLHGTGDSEGDFEDATWQNWRDDVLSAAAHLARACGHRPVLWGVRTGALLAGEAAATAGAEVGGLMLWQPVLDGATFLNQFLRLRIASQLVSDAERETTAQIRDRLNAGEAIEVAGYPLTRAMADGLSASAMTKVAPAPGTKVAWLEIVAKPAQTLATPSRRIVDGWQAAGLGVACETVACPMIWQLHERADAPELRDATLRLWKALA